MALPLLIIGFASLFGSGCAFMDWRSHREEISKIVWTVGLAIIGMYMIVAAIGQLVRHCS
jgi:predicted benzoate:H+ symporter BenE